MKNHKPLLGECFCRKLDEGHNEHLGYGDGPTCWVKSGTGSGLSVLIGDIDNARLLIEDLRLFIQKAELWKP